MILHIKKKKKNLPLLKKKFNQNNHIYLDLILISPDIEMNHQIHWLVAASPFYFWVIFQNKLR